MFDLFVRVYLASVLFSFICGLRAFKFKYPIRFKKFTIFLGLTFLIEFTCNIILHALHVKSKYRNGAYNVFALIEFMFYTYFLYTITPIGWIKKIQLIFVVLFPLIWTFLVFNKTSIFLFHGAEIAVGGVFIVFFALAYLYSLSNQIQKRSIFKIPEFWVAIGLIVFYCCETPYMGSLAYLYEHYPTLADNMQYVSMVINTLMYLLFGYAFLCQKENYS